MTTMIQQLRKKPLLEQMRDALRTRHYSIRTETSYLDWVKRFILFHHKRHPETMAAASASEARWLERPNTKARHLAGPFV